MIRHIRTDKELGPDDEVNHGEGRREAHENQEDEDPNVKLEVISRPPASVILSQVRGCSKAASLCTGLFKGGIEVKRWSHF